MDAEDPDTRVFISGLPPNFTSEQLGAHFAGRYQVTDAVVVADRRIGFVGFRNYTLAKNAIKYFDKSYIRMSKISVQFAKPVEIDRTNGSQAMPKSSRSIAVQNGNSHPQPTFKPYVSVLGSKRKRDDSPLQKPTEVATEKSKDPQNGVIDTARIDEPESKAARKARKAERKAEKQRKREGKAVQLEESHAVGKEQKPENDLSEQRVQRTEDTGKIEGISKQGSLDQDIASTSRKAKRNKSQANGDDTKGGVNSFDLESPVPLADADAQQSTNTASDMDWLREKTSRILDLVDPSELREPTVEPPIELPVEPTQVQEEAEERTEERNKEAVEPIKSASPAPASNGRLFVRNLPYNAEEVEIEALFSAYKSLTEVHLVRDRTGKSKGMAFAQFKDPGDALQALQKVDGKTFQGRLLHVLEASDKRSQQLSDFEISKLPLKKQKALKQKLEAGKSSFSWNSLYMNPDAVLASVADRLGVSKSALIDPSSSDAAVKQAHAETHVIQETKTYFTANGVNIDAFKGQQRDDSVLLVKNFPYGTSIDDLKTLFSPFGDIVRFLLPPSGTIAVLQYSDLVAASGATKQLAYRNFRGAPLYLEKGPKDLFTGPVVSKSKDDGLSLEDEKGHVDDGSSSTLFVRNLNFSTTSSGLAEAFGPLSGFLSAKVKTKFDPRRPKEVLSMGFGFVEFRTHANALAALGAMNGNRLDDHDLIVQLSRRATDEAGERRRQDNQKKSEAHRTKLIIKNLPFESTKKDLRALLSAYGQLRSVKVPQKFDHSTRGFAFADFVSAKEAENAMEALKDTHLLGRRLVFEFAAEEATDPEAEIRAMESKVGRQMDLVDLKNKTGSVRKKFSVGGEEPL